MSVSALFGTRIAAVPPPLTGGVHGGAIKPALRTGGLGVECSSRPKKKATAHHMKTRPKKTQPWDIRRRTTVYDPLPPLPPDWSLVGAAVEEAAPPPPPPPTPESRNE